MKAYLGRYILCSIYQLADRFPRKDVGKFRRSIWRHQSTTTSCSQPPSMTPPSTMPVTTPSVSPPSPTACRSLLPSTAYNHGTQLTTEQPMATWQRHVTSHNDHQRNPRRRRTPENKHKRWPAPTNGHK